MAEVFISLVCAAGLDGAIVSMAREKLKLEEQDLPQQRGPRRCWALGMHSHSADAGNVQLGSPLKESLIPNCKDFSGEINPKATVEELVVFTSLTKGAAPDLGVW